MRVCEYVCVSTVYMRIIIRVSVFMTVYSELYVK